MSTKVQKLRLTKKDVDKLLRDARMSRPELSERLGHWMNAAYRWGEHLPRYAVAYMRLRKHIYDVVEHIEFGTVPDDFDFIAALRSLGIKKIELARILGVSKYTVTRWGNEPPQYAKEYVYTRYILTEGLENGKRTEQPAEPEPDDE